MVHGGFLTASYSLGSSHKELDTSGRSSPLIVIFATVINNIGTVVPACENID